MFLHDYHLAGEISTIRTLALIQKKNGGFGFNKLIFWFCLGSVLDSEGEEDELSDDLIVATTSSRRPDPGKLILYQNDIQPFLSEIFCIN